MRVLKNPYLHITSGRNFVLHMDGLCRPFGRTVSRKIYIILTLAAMRMRSIIEKLKKLKEPDIHTVLFILHLVLAYAVVSTHVQLSCKIHVIGNPRGHGQMTKFT